MDRFRQECAFLENIRHPNIVQYLCVTRDPESRLPVLLMELLDGSLTKMLECSQQSLAYYVQVDICHDIALAVAYLHSNDIIHRDLSSNNVLMIAGRRAKVTDFGMSKLAGAAPSMTPLTTCPGTLAYMPPEALREPPRYTKKLDCFSEGVIMIQVCTRLWPEPGPRAQTIQDSRYPMGVIEVPVSETERRKNHIDLIDPNHTLLPIAIDCVQFQERNRPSSEELCQRLTGLKESIEYREDVQNLHDENQAKDDQIVAQAHQLQEKDRLLQQRVTETTSLTKQLQDQLQRHQEEIALRERQLQQLSQQLEEQEQVTADIQLTNHSLQRQVEKLQQQLSQQSLKPPPLPPPSQAQVRGRQLLERESPKELSLQPSLQVDHKLHPLKTRKTILNWRDGGKAPLKMNRGAAVVDGNVAYFLNKNGDILLYDLSSKRWRELARCPYRYSSLVTINGQLTTVGGVGIHYECTNKLLRLQTGQNQFKEVFPSMPTKRCSPTAVTIKEHLIVAGGLIGFLDDKITTTVEVMDTKTLDAVWATVASLPHAYDFASGTICGDRIFMLGGNDNKGWSKSVLTCSLTELLQSSSSSSIWHGVADAPAYYSTCAAVNGELLAVGGCDKDGKPTAAILKYNPTTNSWDLISNMPTARYWSLVAVLPTNEMMVVGGRTELSKYLDNVEIAKF